MLRRPDGTPYKTRGTLGLWDPKGNERRLVDQWDEQYVAASGEPILYYPVFIDVSSVDPVYREAKDKFWSPTPTKLWAIYEPPSVLAQINLSGTLGPVGGDATFRLNYAATMRTLGGFPKVGSRIHSTLKGTDWQIEDYATVDHQFWGIVGLKVICRKFQRNATGNDHLNPPAPKDYEL